LPQKTSNTKNFCFPCEMISSYILENIQNCYSKSSQRYKMKDMSQFVLSIFKLVTFRLIPVFLLWIFWLVGCFVCLFICLFFLFWGFFLAQKQPVEFTDISTKTKRLERKLEGLYSNFLKYFQAIYSSLHYVSFCLSDYFDFSSTHSENFYGKPPLKRF